MTESTTQETPQAGDRPPRRREPAFNIAGVALAILGACVAIQLARMYLLGPDANDRLIQDFAFLPARYTGGYTFNFILAVVSPFTYAFLHGSAAHLAVNMIWLTAFGSPLAYRLGTARFLIFWAASSVASVALHFVLHPYDLAPLIGASGAVSGMMGAAARFNFRIDRRGGRPGFYGPVLPLGTVFRSRAAVVFLAVWFAVNIVVGLASGTNGSPRIAWEAHIGGFLLGFLAIRLFDPPQHPQEVEEEREEGEVVNRP